MRVLDLFSGMGGLGTGFAKYFQVDTAIDWNHDAVTTYGLNHKSTKTIENDVRNINFSKKDYDGLVGVIGGPPCQDYSVVNLHKNENSDRANLLFEMIRSVKEIKPDFILIENVATVPKKRKEQVRNELIQLGYKVVSKTVYASDFGSVQLRRRWMLVATKLNYVFPEKISHNRKAKEILTGEKSEIKPRPQTIKQFQNLEKGKWVALPGQTFRVYYVVDPCKLLPAIVNPTKLRYIRPDRSGLLSMSELFHATGFDKNYKVVGNLSSQGQQLANAVPVEMSLAFARSISKNFQLKPILEEFF